ncbi:hypothetical protein PGTUg99_011871 [Puccinia graminis f. sp. tritici]|uniref:Uncharacterized protein n=1 Tax=Puccinia graminis f. sp. tritici TaxID=56615 RepID=A0A5B0RQR9_PUCGR|nr:hypothetical protein PGTUg99_011871 [Puccinia graminis f. sp. tritici]
MKNFASSPRQEDHTGTSFIQYYPKGPEKKCGIACTSLPPSSENLMDLSSGPNYFWCSATGKKQKHRGLSSFDDFKFHESIEVGNENSSLLQPVLGSGKKRRLKKFGKFGDQDSSLVKTACYIRNYEAYHPNPKHPRFDLNLSWDPLACSQDADTNIQNSSGFQSPRIHSTSKTLPLDANHMVEQILERIPS